MTQRPDSARARATVEKRSALLAVIREQFQRHGYEDVTIRQLAKAAGCSTGAILNHWPDKPTLFKAAMGRPPVSDAEGAAFRGECAVLWRAIATLGADRLRSADGTPTNADLDRFMTSVLALRPEGFAAPWPAREAI